MSKKADNSSLGDGAVILATTDEEWGTIFTPTGEKTIKPVSPPKDSQTAGKKPFDEEDYLNKLRAKATDMALQILSEARQKAASLVQEAQEQRQNTLEEAKTQGYNEGFAKGHEEGMTKGHEEAYQHSLDEAREELDALRSNMADSVSAVIAAIEGQTGVIYDNWRDDIIAVSKLAVEKIAAVQLDEERVASLTTLLNDAVSTLKKDRRLVIMVSPDDEAVIADILETTKAKYPDITTWEVRGNPDITPGGLVMESEYSLAESLVESRKAAVNTVLSHLTLSRQP